MDVDQTAPEAQPAVVSLIETVLNLVARYPSLEVSNSFWIPIQPLLECTVFKSGFQRLASNRPDEWFCLCRPVVIILSTEAHEIVAPAVNK